MKIGHFGSCLSADPSASLVADYGCEELFRIHHNRSDQFVNYFIDKSAKQIEWNWLLNFLKHKPEFEKDGLTFLENQYAPWIGYENKLRHLVNPESNFFDALDNIKLDVILLDNFMDVVGRVFQPAESGREKELVFFPAHFYENLEEIENYFKMTEVLSPKESAQN